MGKNWYNRTTKYMSWDLKVSNEWVKLVTNFEGLRLEAYYDSVGQITIGYGHTLTAKPGMVITKEEAEELLRDDVERFEEFVNDVVTVPLTQWQFDALVSFCFNLGQGNLGDSTLLEELNKGNYDKAAQEFNEWVYAGGEVLDGLVRRRNAESTMFQGGNWKKYI